MIFPIRQQLSIPFDADFLAKALQFAQQYEVFCLTDGNFPKFENYPQKPFQTILAIGNYQQDNKNIEFTETFEQLTLCNEWLFGFLSYDMKNQVENLTSNHADRLGFPEMYFFVPQHLIFFEQNNEVSMIVIHSFDNPTEILAKITNQVITQEIIPKKTTLKIQTNFSKEYYINSVEKIKQHIVEGDVYELNFCMEFYVENIVINPYQTYLDLKKVSPMPFATFFKLKSRYVMCASPERFLKKTEQTLISQPIKGTSKRGNSIEEDEILKYKLRNSEKEIAENMMIVDLVRNDLAITAKTGSIKVSELFGIYTFPQVHQMISTVTSQLDENFSAIDALKNAFPMGSMTGAPKIKAMELIELYEQTKRSLFSGTIGYITPQKDFDFNVIIRSLFYNEIDKYLTFQAGSAITYDSIASQEHEECLLKTKAIRDVLGVKDDA
jgi:para-aminobenzoate synthetase component 1